MQYTTAATYGALPTGDDKNNGNDTQADTLLQRVKVGWLVGWWVGGFTKDAHECPNFALDKVDDW